MLPIYQFLVLLKVFSVNPLLQNIEQTSEMNCINCLLKCNAGNENYFNTTYLASESAMYEQFGK